MPRVSCGPPRVFLAAVERLRFDYNACRLVRCVIGRTTSRDSLRQRFFKAEIFAWNGFKSMILSVRRCYRLCWRPRRSSCCWDCSCRGLHAHWAAVAGLAVAWPRDLGFRHAGERDAGLGRFRRLLRHVADRLDRAWRRSFCFISRSTSGQFEIVKRSVGAISPDRRMQALLIAFSFGSFLEGAAGFGTPVAISAALLIGLRFSPLYAAGLALLANTSPVAFGALGNADHRAGQVVAARRGEMLLSQMAGRQLPLFSLIVPAWLVATMSGWRGVKGCWPAIVVCGGSFAVACNFSIVQLSWPDVGRRDRRIGLARVPGRLPAILAAEGDLAISRRTRIRRRRADEPPAHAAARLFTPGCRGCLLSADDFSVGLARRSKRFLNGGKPETPNALAGYQQGVVRSSRSCTSASIARAPSSKIDPGNRIGAESRRRPSTNLNWLSATGTGIFLAAILSAFWLRISSACRSCASSSTRCGRCDCAADDRLHVGAGLCHEVQRLATRRWDWPSPNRLAVSVLCAAVGLVGRGADRLGYFVECLVRQPAKNHGRATGPAIRC